MTKFDLASVQHRLRRPAGGGALLLGTNHNDPLCRDALVAVLGEVAPPDFVAVEANSAILSEVARQREKFVALATAYWGSDCRSFAAALSAVISYEADTHRSFLPDAPLYLDDERLTFDGHTPIAEAAAALGQSFWDVCEPATYHGDVHPANDPEGCLVAISRQACQKAAEEMDLAGSSGKLDVKEAWTGGRHETRDVIWAGAIGAKLKRTVGGWGLCIVGARHTDLVPSSVRGILVERKVECEVIDLRLDVMP